MTGMKHMLVSIIEQVRGQCEGQVFTMRRPADGSASSPPWHDLLMLACMIVPAAGCRWLQAPGRMGEGMRFGT